MATQLSEQELLLELRCELEEYITEREAMIIANQIREGKQQAYAYDDSAFFQLIGKIQSVRERLVRFGEK